MQNCGHSIVTLRAFILSRLSLWALRQNLQAKKELEGAENFDELEDTEEPTVNEDGDEREQPANADEGAFDGPDYSDYDDYRDEYGDGPESPEE